MKDDKSGICVHSLTRTPTGASCSACTDGSPTCDETYYTFCTDEKSKNDCTNLTTPCSGAGTYSDSDVIISYEGGKKCSDGGNYTKTCSTNSRYKVSDLSFCPP